jgi:hypothetical protein
MVIFLALEWRPDGLVGIGLDQAGEGPEVRGAEGKVDGPRLRVPVISRQLTYWEPNTLIQL